MLTPIKKSGRYIGIKADGVFHERVEEGTEGAVLRKYKVKDRETGVETEGSKWELLWEDIKNVHITKIEFEDSDFGENILTTLSDGENEVIWAEGTSTNFGTDYMKKLPNVNFAEKLTIKPYAFTDEKGKEKRGITIYQTSDKVMNYFWDEDAKRTAHGFPEPAKDARDTYDKDDWRVHFIGVKKFLTNYTKESILPILATPVENRAEISTNPEDDSISPDSIPF